MVLLCLLHHQITNTCVDEAPLKFPPMQFIKDELDHFHVHSFLRSQCTHGIHLKVLPKMTNADILTSAHFGSIRKRRDSLDLIIGYIVLYRSDYLILTLGIFPISVNIFSRGNILSTELQSKFKTSEWKRGKGRKKGINIMRKR